MKIMKKPWFLSTLFTIVILVAGGLYIGSLLQKEDSLSDSEIRTQLENKYGGTVDALSMENDVYIAEMTRDKASYSVEVDAMTGKVLSLVQNSDTDANSPQVLSEKEAREIIAEKYTGEIEQILLKDSGKSPVFEVEVAKEQALMTVVIDALTGEITSETINETTVEHALITKEKAIEIALGQLQGEVEYVTFEQTDDGGFYLIEIEQDNEEDDDLEAVFQIHATSGIVMSVTWNN